MLNRIAASCALSLFALTSCAGLSPEEEARQIATEAYLYSLPRYENYRTAYRYFVDQEGPDYKGGINEVVGETMEGEAHYAEEKDTLFSFALLDLRSEPLILMLPPIDEHQGYSVALIDLNGKDCANLDSSAIGSNGANLLVAKPGWEGNRPAQVRDVIRATTPFVLVTLRTELRPDVAPENIARIQKGYRIWTLSNFVGEPAPRQAAPMEWIDPGLETPRTPDMFRYLNFLMRFTPMPPADEDAWDRFSKIGIGPGQPWDDGSFEPSIWDAMQDGIDDACATLDS